MLTINKTVRIGSVHLSGYDTLCVNLFAKIQFDGSKLSITGVEGPTRDGNCRGSCGQVVMSEWNIRSYAPGWSAELVQQFRDTWNAWHLNNLQAGSPAQREYLSAHPITGPEHYTQACTVLREAGLNPDPNYLHDGKPYHYGSTWLRKEVPAHVLEFLESLPESDITPSWV